MCVCFLGHGILPDAVRARGGDPVQAGAREEGHHQGNMVGEASGNHSTWYMETHTHTHTLNHVCNYRCNVKQMLERLLLLMGNISSHTPSVQSKTYVNTSVGLLHRVALYVHFSVVISKIVSNFKGDLKCSVMLCSGCLEKTSSEHR